MPRPGAGHHSVPAPLSAAIYKCTRKFPSRRKKTAEAAPKAAKSDKAAKAAPKKTTRKSKES